MNIQQRPSPNYYSLEYPVNIAVLHMTLGAFEGAIQHLSVPNNPSAHFVIGRLGEIAQLVSLDKGAWHAGRISNPSARGRAVLRKTVWGSWKNINKYSWGFEYAAGYDIDRDGIIEGWEKLYTPQQIKAGVLLHLWCEEQKNVIIKDSHIITHKDITSYKPDLEIHRAMFLAELQKQRELKKGSTVVEEKSSLTLKLGQTYRPELKKGKIVFFKV